MSVLNKVYHYQKKIERNKEHTETLIHCMNKLHKLPITVRHLEKTGIGKTINEFRKLDGDVGNIVKALIWKWKRVVFVETVAEEHTKKVKGLTNPIVSNSDESVLNAVKTEEEERELRQIDEDTNTLRSTAVNDDTEMLQEIYENGQISSTANLSCNGLDYESLRCDALHNSNKEENKPNSPTETISHVFAVHQSISKTEEQKHSHHRRHSSKHHTRKSRDKPKHNLKGKEVHSELKIKKDRIKIKPEKVHTKNENNKQEEKKYLSFGSSPKHKHYSKRAENETKYKESKYCRKEQGQKRETVLSEISTENIPKQSKSSEKVKAYDETIDYFGEALRMGDTIGNKSSSSTTTSLMRNSNSKSSPNTKTTNVPFNSHCAIIPTKPDLSLADVKLQSLDVEIDLVSMLSEMASNYNPLSHLPLTVEAPTLKHDAKQALLAKQHRQRMKVYSGVKTGRPIPTLHDLSLHVLKENIDALEYTGGVPYNILKPILQQATPEQLFQVEYYNPYLIENTNELWEFHCQKEFHSGQLQPMETAREMYLRCLDEREAKFKELTCNIQQSLIKSSAVRKTKLAYIESDPKPPRNVAKEQANSGTGSIKISDIGKSQISKSVLMPVTSTIIHGFLNKSTYPTARKKTQLAPLMKKTIKLAKSFKR